MNKINAERVGTQIWRIQEVFSELWNGHFSMMIPFRI